MRRMLSLGRLEYGTASTAQVTWRKKERLFSLPISTSSTTTSTTTTTTETTTTTTTTTTSATTTTIATVPPSPIPATPSFERALVDLAFFYFERYGPASVDDFIWWTGLSPLVCRVAVKAIQSQLVLVKVVGMPEDLFLFKSQLDKLKAAPKEVPKMTRLLPYEDAIIKAYKATRYRFFGEGAETIETAMKHGISKGGEARPTVWLDGAIVGMHCLHILSEMGSSLPL